MTVRLYASDHDAINTMGKVGGLFVREAVRKAQQQQTGNQYRPQWIFHTQGKKCSH